MTPLQSFHYISSANTSSHTITLAQPATAGSTLFLFTASNAIVSITGFSKIANSLNGLDVSAWTKTMSGGETSVVANLSAAADCFANGWEFSSIGATTVTSTDTDGSHWTSGDGIYIYDGDWTPTQDSVFMSIFAVPDPSANATDYMTTYDAPLNDSYVVQGVTAGTFTLAASSSLAPDVAANTTVHAKATNTDGLTVAGASQGIILLMDFGTTPLGVSTPATANATVGAGLQLTATTSGGQGAQTWSWTQLTGATATIINSNQATATVICPSAGTYSFQVQVSDTTGSPTATVTVTAANPPATRYWLQGGTWVAMTTTQM